MRRMMSLFLFVTIISMGVFFNVYAETDLTEVKKVINKMSDGKVALLPPDFHGPAFEFARKTGFINKVKILTPEQIIDSKLFVAKNFPVAVYMGGEHYITTVKKEGDAKDGMINYLKSGGIIVFLPYEPWPMYHEITKGKWTDNMNIFFEDLGIYFITFESPDPDLSMKFNNKQNIVAGLKENMEFPKTGDFRLRAIDPYEISYNAKLTPIITVKDKGDAMGYIEFVDGEAKGGKIIYTWFTLMHQDYGEKILNDVFKYIAKQVK